MGKNGKLDQDAKDKKVNVPKRLGILIIPAGLLFVILLVFCVLFPDFWHIAFWEYFKEVMLRGGFIITMLINILWISNAFINIDSFLDKSYKKGKTSEKMALMGIKYMLLKPLDKKLKSSDYSFLFYELTVRFLILVALEISVCYMFFSNRLAEVLALTLPMVTVFIVCSCFIVSRNDRFVFDKEISSERNAVCDIVRQVIDPQKIGNQNQIIFLFNVDKGTFYVNFKMLEISLQHDEDIHANLARIKVVGCPSVILNMTDVQEEQYRLFEVPPTSNSSWDTIKQKEKISLIFIFNYWSNCQNREDSVEFGLLLNIKNNQLTIVND